MLDQSLVSLPLANPVRRLSGEDLKGPVGETCGVIQSAKAARDRQPGFLHHICRRISVPGELQSVPQQRPLPAVDQRTQRLLVAALGLQHEELVDHPFRESLHLIT